MLKLLSLAALVVAAAAVCPSTISPGEHLRTVVVGGVERTFYVSTHVREGTLFLCDACYVRTVTSLRYLT